MYFIRNGKGIEISLSLSGKYFKTICEVEEPEVRFNVDQYTDVAKVTKPMIYIQINEIIETHKVWSVQQKFHSYFRITKKLKLPMILP